VNVIYLIHLIQTLNCLELAPKCAAPVEDNQAKLDSKTSDEELSKSKLHQEAEPVSDVRLGNSNLGFYITGKSSPNRSSVVS